MKKERIITVLRTKKSLCILAGIRFPYILFAYLDTCDNLSESLFIKHGIRAKIRREYILRENPVYKMILCNVRKKDGVKFLEIIDDLTDKMHICGHPDYEKFCENAILKIATANKNAGSVQA